MRIVTVIFALLILAGMVVLVVMNGEKMLIAMQSVSPTMPALRN